MGWGMNARRPPSVDKLATIINEFRRSIGLRREEFRDAKVDVFNEPDPRAAVYKAQVVCVPDFERAKQWCLEHELTGSNDTRKLKDRMLRMLRRRLRRNPRAVPSDIAYFKLTEFF